MKAAKRVPKDIDEYISGFPPEVQVIMRKLRTIIHEVVPDAQEIIKYGMPTFTLGGNLVYFAGYKKHVALYPMPEGTAALQKEMAAYKRAKSSLGFPLDKPAPYGLIRRVVKALLKEHLARPEAGRYGRY